MDFIIVTAIVVVLIALICSTIVTVSVFKYIDKIGDAKDDKQKSLKGIITSRTLFNFYPIVMLTFIILVRALNLIDAQLFIALFVADIGGLGLKISREILQKQK